MISAPVEAQTCMEYSPPDNIFDTSVEGCKATPAIDRAFFPGTYMWGSQEYLVFSMGNELSYFDMAKPESPSRISVTAFRVGNQGDSDHDLLSYLAHG